MGFLPSGTTCRSWIAPSPQATVRGLVASTVPAASPWLSATRHSITLTLSLIHISDGNCIETVVMRYHYGSPPGWTRRPCCRMGCRFCASTQAGRVLSLIHI